MDKLTFSFDIGYASIGWGALKGGAQPEVLGAGVVLFPKDDCLASHRRVYRRMRRAIRSRRQRIERVGRILEHYGVITAEERKLPGHAAPFWLAARALAGKVRLSGLEVWHLMRWYAHNRGYDGNSMWSGGTVSEEEGDDTAKVEAAKANMKKLGTSTMAETVTKLLDLELDGHQSSMQAYKTLDMAFPREVVEAEVQRLLTQHSELPAHVAQLIIGHVEELREELAACDVRLPRRFAGSVLFGQLLPRFDNRLIARCPITWAHEYKNALEEGKTDKDARALADKYAKVPKADCREFYEYRFARILCNIRAEGKPLAADLRVKLMEQAREVGRFTVPSFKKAVKELIGDVPNNLYNFFQIHPDSDKALIVDPQKGGGAPATGRAPYARPVLRRVVEEVLRGEDPTKAALSLTHPDGENKEQDGVLYCLLDPESEVSCLQATRRVEDMSNNHLVRHRMLIFKRLLRDMISKYAEGDASRVGQFCIEVGRELSEFSGMSSKEIAKELGNRMKHFHDAVKHLEKNAPHLALSAGLIRKCRIAMDMNWTCPFTGQKYGAQELPGLEREHIIPHANRHSNSLASLVLTWPEVNRMKGKRTGLQFVKEDGGKEVPGRSNISIMTEKRYRALVDKLDTKGAPDDRKRKAQRKKMMLVDTLTEKTLKEENLGFTDGMMTQSSQLMKIAAHVAKGLCSKAKITMIPGSVTAAVRASWKAWGLLGKICPEVIDAENGRTRPKDDIRGITHLHHAVDACVLGLIPMLIPAGTNGVVWQALGMRQLSEKQVAQLRQVICGQMLQIDEERRVHLCALPAAVRESFIRALQEERVVTHVPADMSGARFEENTRGVKEVRGNVATLRKYKRERTDVGSRSVICEEKEMLIDKLVGIDPGGKSKLREVKGVRVVTDNYGVAFIPDPVVLPHHCVYKRLSELRKNYGAVVLLRQGQCIRIVGHKDARMNRVWRVVSVMNDKSKGPLLSLQRPSTARNIKEKHGDNKRDIIIRTLQKYGFDIMESSYIGNEEE